MDGPRTQPRLSWWLFISHVQMERRPRQTHQTERQSTFVEADDDDGDDDDFDDPDGQQQDDDLDPGDLQNHIREELEVFATGLESQDWPPGVEGPNSKPHAFSWQRCQRH